MTIRAISSPKTVQVATMGAVVARRVSTAITLNVPQLDPVVAANGFVRKASFSYTAGASGSLSTSIAGVAIPAASIPSTGHTICNITIYGDSAGCNVTLEGLNIDPLFTPAGTTLYDAMVAGDHTIVFSTADFATADHIVGVAYF